MSDLIVSVPLVGVIYKDGEAYRFPSDTGPAQAVDAVGAGEGDEAFLVRGDGLAPAFQDGQVIICRNGEAKLSAVVTVIVAAWDEGSRHVPIIPVH